MSEHDGKQPRARPRPMNDGQISAAGSNPPTIAYVAGYGRSGSTLLDVMLGNITGVTSLGEIGWLWRPDATEAEFCSCGLHPEQCPFWGGIVQNLRRQSNAAEVLRAFRRLEGIPGNLIPSSVSGRLYAAENRSAFGEIHFVTGARVLVDSSKTAYRFPLRPWALRHHAGLDVRVIHLVRHPRAVLRSALKGRNSQLRRGNSALRVFETLRTLIGWSFANLLAVINGRLLGRNRYCRVFFEDLLDKTADTLKSIGGFIDILPDPVILMIDEGKPLSTTHLIGGNRMLSDRTLIVRSVEEGHDPALSFAQRLGCSLLSAWIYALLRRRSKPRSP